MGYFEYPLEKQCFFWFSLLIITEGKICGIRSTKRCNCKIFVQVSITFLNLRLAISVNRVPWNFLKSRFRYCFFVFFVFFAKFLRTPFLQNTSRRLLLVLNPPWYNFRSLFSVYFSFQNFLFFDQNSHYYSLLYNDML